MNSELRQQVEHANSAVNIVADYMSVVNLDDSVYKILVHVESHATGLSEEETRVLEHMRESMSNEGVGIEGDGKEECLMLQQLENKLSFELSGGLASDSGYQAGGSSSSSSSAGTDDAFTMDYWVAVDQILFDEAGRLLSELERRKASGGQIEVNLNTSRMGAMSPALNDMLLRKLSNAKHRRHIFRVQNMEDPEAEQRLVELLNTRQRLSQLRGYDNYNVYAQRDSILGGPRNVRAFLHAAWSGLLPGIRSELSILGTLKKEQDSTGDAILRPWDVSFYMDRHKEAHEKEINGLAPYLSYRTLMRGVNDILAHIGVSFRQVDPSPCEVWHPGVEKYILSTDGTQRVAGILYIDPTARPEKRVQSAQFTLKGSKTFTDGARQIPRTALVCSLPPAGNGMPPLAATTFMHEIGHCVHSLLSETRLQHLSGTRGAVDFVELPSHLFEYYVMDPDALSMYLKRGEGGKV